MVLEYTSLEATNLSYRYKTKHPIHQKTVPPQREPFFYAFECGANKCCKVIQHFVIQEYSILEEEYVIYEHKTKHPIHQKTISPSRRDRFFLQRPEYTGAKYTVKPE